MGFSINKTDGDWIRQYLTNPQYKVTADCKNHWKYQNVNTYNVVGTLQGENHSAYSLIGAHYDAWWSQGAIDEGAETMLALTIGKYMKELSDNNILPKNDVKIVAFGAEELAMRGSKDFIKKHGNDDIKYFINPGNFGQTLADGNISLIMDYSASKDSSEEYLPDYPGKSVAELFVAIAEAMNFEESGLQACTNNVVKDYAAEDSFPFFKTSTGLPLQFGRETYKGYHQGNDDHTAGDTMSVIHNQSMRTESELVTSMALHLLYDHNRTITLDDYTLYDSDNDGINDSVNVSYSVNADIPTWGKVRAKLISPTQATVSSNRTELLAFNHSTSAEGELNLTLPSNQLSTSYNLKVEISDFFDRSIDDEDNVTIALIEPVSTIHANFLIDNDPNNKTVELTDTSYASAGCTLTNWSWDFGDDSTSTERNPEHTYSYIGTYDITLVVEDENGNNDSKTKSVSITGNSPLVEINLASSETATNVEPANFRSSVDDSDNPTPLRSSAFNYSWDMGDGTKYYTENATHTYGSGGTYTVSLTVTDLDNYTGTYTMEYFTPDILVEEGIADNRSTHHWSSLSDGVDDASAGDIIYVANGSYNAGFSISSNLTLIGECRENITINTSTTVFTINSNNVSLSNMTLTGGTTGIAIDNQSNITLSGLHIRNMTYGVSIINHSYNITVDWSSFENNTYGIYATDSDTLMVGGFVETADEAFNNTFFKENTRAIYLDDMLSVVIFNIDVNATIPYTSLPPPTYGIDMDDTEGVYVNYAHIYNAHTSAINIDESDSVEITGSHIEENEYGIYYTDAEDCFVAGCLINDNDEYGVVFSDVLCLDNMVVCNDFINNTAYDSSNAKAGPTAWSLTAGESFRFFGIGEGNYWNVSGVLFEDANGDGIADDEMSLDGPLRRDPEDPLPVMERYDWLS